MKYEYINSVSHLTENEIKDCLEKIRLLNIEKKGSVLEIPAGGGELTLSLVNNFDFVESVVVNGEFYSPDIKEYKRNYAIENLQINKVNKEDIKDYIIDNFYKYDFIIISSDICIDELSILLHNKLKYLSSRQIKTNNSVIFIYKNEGKFDNINLNSISEKVIQIELQEHNATMALLEQNKIVEEPAVEEPAVEEPAVEEPAVEEPVVEEPVVEEPVVEDKQKTKRRSRSRKTNK